MDTARTRRHVHAWCALAELCRRARFPSMLRQYVGAWAPGGGSVRVPSLSSLPSTHHHDMDRQPVLRDTCGQPPAALARRRLRVLTPHLCSRQVHGTTDANTQRFRSPWSDADGSIRAAWQHGSKTTYTRSDRKKGFKVLSEADHIFFEREGWVLIHNAVPQENIEAMKEATVRTLRTACVSCTKCQLQQHQMQHL